jgi:hypothetical protein
MNEERYASRVRQALNHGLPDIPPAAARRREAARQLAVARQKQTAPELALGGGGTWRGHLLSRTGVDGGPSQSLQAIGGRRGGMWISFYWHSVQYVSEIEAIDVALLADDLPPEAFLDHEFIEWLKDDSAAD